MHPNFAEAPLLQQRVLILNRCYLPIHITTVKRAVNLLSLDIALGVDVHYQTYTWTDLIGFTPDQELKESFHTIQTVRDSVAIPKVLVLNSFDRRPPQGIRFSRGQIFLRDHHTCQYCGNTLPKTRLNLDHVVPKVQGGKTTWENIVTSCHTCNRRKGPRTPNQAGMPLRSQPTKPPISPLLVALQKVHRTWSVFLSPQLSD